MNPLLAVVRGTSKAAESALTSAKKQVGRAVMPSAQTAYNLGMGIGPLLQSIVNEIERKTDKKDDKKAKIAEKAKNEAKVQSKMLATQMNTMITVLRDIKNIGLLQLRSDQQKQFEARHQEYLSKEYDQEHPGKEKDTIFGISKEKLTPSDSLMTKLALGGAGLAGIWGFLLTDEVKDQIKDQLFGEDGLTKTLLKGWVAAFKEAPLLTILGTGIAAHVTGILEVLGVAGFVAWKSGKLVYNIGKYIGTGMAATSAAPAVGAAAEGGAAAAAAAAAAANAVKAAPPAATAMSPQVAAAAAQSKALLEQIAETQRGSGPQEPVKVISSAAIAATEEVATTGSKVMGALRMVASGVSHVLGALGVVGSAYSAYEEGKQGKTITASLYGASAAMGTAAVASAFGPGTQVATPWLAGGSAIAGALGFVSSFFEDNETERTQKEMKKRWREQQRSSGAPQTTGNLQAPQPAASRTGNVNVPAEEVMGIIRDGFGSAGYNDNQIWAALANAARESNFNPNAHNTSGEDSVGLFQMNRSGGLGRGMSIDQLKDPYFNTQLLLNALSAAESQPGYFGEAARGFRQARSKEEAAEHLRRFLFGNGTAAQQLAGANRQQQVNADFSAGKYGRMPDISPSTYANSSFAANAASAGAAAISPSNVSSNDAKGASQVAEITSLVNDYMKLVAGGGGIQYIDNSSKSTNVSQGSTGGGEPARVMDTIRSEITGIVYPAIGGYT